MDLKSSTILITGGSSGIGLEFVKQLTALGARVIITGRKQDALDRAKQQFPSIHTHRSDVGNPRDIETLYNLVIKDFPQLNVVINNAGEMRLLDLQEADLSLDNLTREINVNLTGAIQMGYQFLPHLLARPSAAIVNVSSAIAFMAYSSAPVYSASKAGIHAYTQAMRLQLSKTHLKVIEVIPPGVNTNLQNDWAVQPNPRQMMVVDKMVAVAIKGLQRGDTEIKPLLVKIIKFLSRLMPGTLVKFGHGEFEKFQKTKTKSK